MKKHFISLILLSLQITLFSQTTEHYLRITISDRSELELLTQMVSIDNVVGNEVIAYTNDIQFEKLKTSHFKFVELEHPSVQAGKAITMATTVEQMANWDRYPTYNVYNQLMVSFTENYPNLCRLDTIGTSVLNRNILSLNVTADVNNPHPKPEVFFSSTMHGDEVTGWILCMRLADYLLSNYGVIDRITNMLDSVSIFIAPNTNPDGTYRPNDNSVINARRSNNNGVDLNRDYPDPRIGQNTPWQKETIAMMDYASERNFILSINYHGGAEVANYPWDTWTSSQNSHADNNWFIQISKKYADLAQANGTSNYFKNPSPNGYINGGNWYVITGGRQDYTNYWHNCREITLEVSTTKMPQSENLPNYWNWNHEAMLTYIENVKYGIRGFVTNEDGEPLNAKITVIGHDKDNSHVVTNPQFGNYYRMIQNGTYNLLFEVYGYDSQTISGVSVPSNTSTTILDVTMQKSESYTVSGVVVNSQTGFPEPNVKIEVKNSPIVPIFTDNKGNFTIDLTGGQYQIIFSKDGFTSKEETFLVINDIGDKLVIMQVFEGIDFEDNIIPAGFSFSGNQPWFITNTAAHEGTRSIRSGIISDNQTSTMTYTFNAPTSGQVSFYLKVSSENNWDWVRFYIDDVQKGQWSGEIDWTEYSYDISAGNYTLLWTYVKDYSISSGYDAAFVDLISTPKINQNAVPYINPRIINIETEEISGESIITMWNIGNSDLNYNATIENEEINNWLSLSNNSGTVASTQNTEFMLTYDFNLFNDGLYEANLLIEVVDSVITIPVSINYIVENDSGIPKITPRRIYIETEEVTGDFIITMQNIGKTPFEYEAIIEPEQSYDWLSLFYEGNILEPEQQTEFILNYDLSQFNSQNFYSAYLKIDVKDSIISIPIEINYLLDIFSSHSDHFMIYPNPTSDIFTIIIPKLESTAKLEISTTLGQSIYTGQINNKKQTFSLSDLGITTQGIYLIKIESGDFTGIGKIVIGE